MKYFWLNCGYNRFNHFEDLMGQVSVFDSSVHFNPSEGYAAFKRAEVGDKVIFYQVQNKIGLLGAGTVVKYEEPKRGQIKIHFKYEEKLLPLDKEYLERSEQLKISLYRMKEQLLNQISEEDYNFIMALGRGEEKINRYFLMKEMENFKQDESYTIYAKTVNGIERKGFKHYTEMQEGDKIIIYRTAPERGIYGTATIEQSLHKEPIIIGRTDTTAITLRYDGDIKGRTIYDLDREPMLRAQYFVDENWNESVTELTKIQYEAMLNPTETEEEPAITSYAEQLAKAAPKKHVSNVIQTVPTPHQIEHNTPHKILHIFLSRTLTSQIQQRFNLSDQTPHAIASKHWTHGELYGQYFKDGDHWTTKDGIITDAIKNKMALIIEDIERIDVQQFKPLLHAAAGRTIDLAYNGQTLGKENATITLTPDFKVIGTTTLAVQELKSHFPEEMHGFIKVYQIK